jgi:amino acid adenylation domain-containing protein
MTTEVIEGFQLSPQQEHLWLLQQVTASSTYFVKCTVLIEGNIETTKLVAALQNIVNRHEILRTTFKYVPGMIIPVQVITNSNVRLNQQYHLESYNSQVQTAKIAEIFQKFTQQNFDSESDSPLYISLATLSESKHILFIGLPALCGDVNTLINLVYELSNLYANSEQVLVEPLQYADFSEWENELIKSEGAEIGREYWRKQDLSDVLNLQLPFEKYTAESKEFKPEFFTLKINTDLKVHLAAIAKKYNTSISVFLLASWTVLLWRLTQQQNLLIGKVFEGRKFPELEEAMGLFAKCLPLTCHLTEQAKFAEILQQISETEQEIYKWQECFSWELITHQLAYYPVCFDFADKYPKYTDSYISFEIQNHSACIERFKIKLSCVDKNDDLFTEFHYDSYRFDAQDIQRLSEQFHTLLESAIKHPEAVISELEILSDRAKHQLLVEFNQTQADYPKDKCIHQLIEHQVQQQPNNIAVEFEKQKLTYSQLNKRANQLANYLQQIGVTPGTLVGICVERSFDMIVGILGILKAGAAYLPLDPTYPQERLTWILENSQTTVLLTQQPLREKLPTHQAQVICLDTDWEIIARQNQENLTLQITPNNLAYIIHTSGSTGTPKGVQITHRNLVHSTTARINYYQKPVSRFLLLSSFAFDSSVAGIFWTLCCGGTLVLPQEGWQREVTQLVELIYQHHISHLLSLPSLYALILQQAKQQQLASLHTIIVAGEICSNELVKRHQKYLPGAYLYNEYGPTEGTVWSTVYHCQSQELTRVPIGCPITNTQVYILDAKLHPVAIGVPGEIYIGGDGLALGYLHQPELTAEKFITNPFSNEPTARLYKTGDLAQYLADGNIEFLGRIDHQVKIRGYRIELGEIEFVLNQHPDVAEAIVIAREDEPTNQRLVAYIVPKVTTINNRDLRQFLRGKLPDYMIPSAFTLLEAFPLSPNGKIDRRALPTPEEINSNCSETFVAPRTPIEEILANIWAEVLGIKQVGISDNFFELGGHSIVATQIVSRIRETLQVELMLRSLFESPTIAGLAAQIAAIVQDRQNLFIPPLHPRERQQEIPLSFAQQRLWFLSQLEPDSPAYNVNGAIRIQGAINIEALHYSINEIVKRHEVLRTQLIAVDGKPVQVIVPELVLLLPIINLKNLTEIEQQNTIQELIFAETQRVFNLAIEPLLRVKLLSLSEQENILLFTMHHIISDGWSKGVLIRELAAVYTEFVENKPSSLPELPIQYADFALWQREWLQCEQLQTQVDYWKQQLGGDLPVLALPTDNPRPAVQTFAGKTLSFVLPNSLTEALKSLSKQEGVTLFMTLLAGFKTLLYRYTDQTDILVGSPIANRNRSEIENLIGFFVNTLVLRTDLSGNPSFQELLGRIRETTLGADAHQDLPFEKLVEELQPERNLSHTPFFQVMFAFQNAPTGTLELPDLNIEFLEVNTETAKFDLTLTIQNTVAELIGTIEYNTDLFDKTTISRLVKHFETLLTGIVANPQQQVGNLPLLTTTEQQQLLGWNNTEIDFGNQLCLHQLFEAQVEKTPDAVAVVFENEQLTYQELNQRANQLAHYLHNLGVKPEILVGICVERSLEMVVGLLAVLKAGGAYLPLDPAYPQERISFMLADAQVPVVLTQQRLFADLPANSAQIICLDNLITQESTENLSTEVSSENLAYVIYTSGSTGQSKGVMIQHHNLTNAYLAWEEAYQLRTAASTHLQMASFSFDVFTGDLVRAFCSGGKLLLCPRDLLLEAAKLYELMLREKIDCAEFVPAVLRNLILYLEQNHKCLDFMQLIICGSDSWYGQEYEKFHQFCGSSTRLINSFGLTEATIDSTYFETQTIGLSGEQLVPIGSPFANTQIYILDSYFQPVPVGIIGEIYIGGAGLARGYLQRPDLTAEKFIPNLFSQKPGDIIYKTGDLGRYLADGQIELVGRIDNQVKIRGFRIELGEIESVLNQYPGVQANVVIVREDKPGDQRLVAYIVSKSKPDINTPEVRSFLQEKLPNYMLPTAFVILDKLPLTPNGKVDRKALPAPDIKNGWEESFVPPRTPTEQIIADIWADVLSLEQVGIYDNFFKLGGHSLLATQVISRLREAFKIDLPLRSLFENPTVKNLVERIEGILTVQKLQVGSMQMPEDREEIEL